MNERGDRHVRGRGNTGPPQPTHGDMADDPLEAARTELGRALVLLGRLQEHNPASPALAELRNHIEGAWRLIGGDG